MNGELTKPARLLSVIRQSLVDGVGMHSRLMIYFIILLTILLVAVFGFLSFFGLFLNVEKKTASILNTYLNEYAASVMEHFDSAAARSIKFSQNLSTWIDNELAANGADFSSMNDNPQAIADLENKAFSLAEQTLLQSDASGVFFILDVTSNTKAQDAKKHKSGLHIKIGNMNTSNPINPMLYLFRGTAETARKNGIIHHNHWDMEFNTDDINFYDRIKQDAGSDLVQNWYASPVIDLPLTWDDAAFVAVPIYGKDGVFYGICGLEISKIYYMHSHMLSASEFRNIAGLLARAEDNDLRTDSGLESGTYGGYSASVTHNILTSEPNGALINYSDGQRRFIGLERSVALSPLDGADKWKIAVMTPESDYNAMTRNQTMMVILLLALVSTISVLAAVLLSKRYVQPITEGLALAKQGGSGRSKIPEINDLLDFLTDQDAAREQAGQSMEKASPLIASYMSFMRKLDTLTETERDIFDLYMNGLTAQQITTTQHISINTVKFHNKNIYAKLGISSRNELILLGRMIQGKESETDGQ